MQPMLLKLKLLEGVYPLAGCIEAPKAVPDDSALRPLVWVELVDVNPFDLKGPLDHADARRIVAGAAGNAIVMDNLFNTLNRFFRIDSSRWTP